MKRWNLIALIVAFFSLGVGPKLPKTHLHLKMVQMAGVMNDLFPQMFHEDSYEFPDDMNYVNEKLDLLYKHFSEATPHFEKYSYTQKVSQKVMLTHLKNIRRFNKLDDYYLQKKLFKVTSEICISCHSQDQKKRTFLKELHRDQFKTDFEYAEYNYITRNYKKALKYYDKFLVSGKARGDFYRSNMAIRRELAMYSQKWQDPGQGSKHFRYLLSNKKFPLDIRPLTKGLAEGLEDWKKRDDFKGKRKFVDLQRFVAIYLDPLVSKESTPKAKDTVMYFRLAGHLFEYLQSSEAKKHEIPQILFWLAIANRAVSYNYFFSLSDVYLEQCMIDYPKHEFAKKCFYEYKKHAVLSYGVGKNKKLPPEVKKEIQRLRGLVF